VVVPNDAVHQEAVLSAGRFGGDDLLDGRGLAGDGEPLARVHRHRFA